MKYCLFFVVICVSIGCASCSQVPSPPKTVRLSMQDDPFSLDPRVAGDRRSQLVLRVLYEGLTRINKEGVPELAAAKHVSLSQDFVTYTFHLRDTVWSNGRPLTARDFEYAWKSVLDPNFAAPYAHVFFVIANARKAKLGLCSLDDVGVSALDHKTLRVTLEHPVPYFLELVANPIFSPLIRGQQNSPEDYVSNGPFVLREQVLKSHLVLEKNERYRDEGSVKVDVIHFSILRDGATAYNLFCRGDLDWYGDPCCIIPLDIFKNMQVPLIKKQTGGLFWLSVNTRKKHLSSPKIRKAIACAINREDIVSFLAGGETLAYSILPSRMSMLDSPPFVDYDIKAAVSLFNEGLQEVGLTKDEFPAVKLTFWNEPATKRIMELVQQQIQTALGIVVCLESLDWMPFVQRTRSGEIDVAATAWNPWVDDPMYNLSYLQFRDNGINATGWHSEEYCHELDAAAATTLPQIRQGHLKRAEEIFANHLPIIPLFHLCYRYTKGRDLCGEAISPVGGFDFTWLEREEGA